MRLANKEQLLLYFKMGKMLAEKIAAHQWGAKIIKQIAVDLQKQLPGLRGFSERNLINMKAFYNGYQSVIITQSPTAQINERAFFGISFSHHILLLDKCKSVEERVFYMVQAANQFWSVDSLRRQIVANVFEHQGKLPNNFSETLSEPLRASVLQVFQDEYLMDFIDPSATENERVFEQSIVADIKSLILTLGKGFCFIGNQYRLEVGATSGRRLHGLPREQSPLPLLFDPHQQDRKTGTARLPAVIGGGAEDMPDPGGIADDPDSLLAEIDSHEVG